MQYYLPFEKLLYKIGGEDEKGSTQWLESLFLYILKELRI